MIVQIDAKTNGSVPILTDTILLRSGACLVHIRPHSHSTEGLSRISKKFSGLASSASQLLKFEEQNNYCNLRKCPFMGVLQCHIRLNFCSVVTPNYDNPQELGKKKAF
jgi:hypothetical protein